MESKFNIYLIKKREVTRKKIEIKLIIYTTIKIFFRRKND